MEPVTQTRMLDGFYLQDAAVSVMPYAGDASHILAALSSVIPVVANGRIRDALSCVGVDVDALSKERLSIVDSYDGY